MDRKDEDNKLKNADTKAGAKNRGINDKGSPILRVGGVPGYNMATGTPGWIKAAASHAEGWRGQDGGKETPVPHRQKSEHQAGAPSYGKQPADHTQGGDGKQKVKKGR